MKKTKKNPVKNDLVTSKLKKLVVSRKMLLFGVAFLILLGLGYGVGTTSAKMQKDKQLQDKKSAQTAQQLNSLSEKIIQLQQENILLKATPSAIPSPSPVTVVKYVQAPAPSPTDDLAARKVAFNKKVQDFVAKAKAEGDDNTSIMNTIKFEYQLEFGQPLIIDQPSKPTLLQQPNNSINCSSTTIGNHTSTNCY